MHNKPLSDSLYSVWRPVVAVVEQWALTLCDQRTVPPTSHILCDKVHSDHAREGVYIEYSSSYKWYWLSKQTTDEPVIFISWDSQAGTLPCKYPTYFPFYYSN
jgi:hypothetical protein